MVSRSPSERLSVTVRERRLTRNASHYNPSITVLQRLGHGRVFYLAEARSDCSGGARLARGDYDAKKLVARGSPRAVHVGRCPATVRSGRPSPSRGLGGQAAFPATAARCFYSATSASAPCRRFGPARDRRTSWLVVEPPRLSRRARYVRTAIAAGAA
jgi:hypothetical protein